MKQLYRKFLVLSLTTLLCFTVGNLWGQGLEDFTNSNATSSYGGNTFTGNDGIDWTYVASRDGNNDTNGSGIDLPALMLRRVADDSKITSSTIAGGIGNFSVKLYKGFTGGGNRQVELFVNGVSQGTSTAFDNFDEQIFEVNNINIGGDIIIEIRNITSSQIIIDDITWTGFIPCTPPTTQATIGTTTAINDNDLTLNWTRGDGDNVLILAKEGSAVDADPESGTPYNTADLNFGDGEEIGTGNFVVYNGTGTSATVTGLAIGTTYHFAIYEFNTADDCYLTPAGTTSETTTGNALPVLNSVATATAGTTNDIILTFSENVTGTDETGISVTIDGAGATINSLTGNGTSEWTLTLAEEIAKNSGAILISYDDVAGDLVDDEAAVVASFTDEVVTNNTTSNLVADIAAARLIGTGDAIKISGEVYVSYVTGNGRNQFFVQDATGGLLVDDNAATFDPVAEIGDGIINFEADLTTFSGVLQAVPTAYPGINSTANTITPIVVSITDFTGDIDTYESRLIQLSEVTFESANGTNTFADVVESNLSDGTNTLMFDADNGNFDFTNIDYNTEVIPFGRFDVIGIAREASGTAKITSRTFADIEDNYAPEFTTGPTAGTPTTSAFDVTFRLDEEGTVYYLVDETTNSTPDVATVLASAETVAYTDPTADGTISLSGLTDNTVYYVHIVAVDDEGTPNEQTSVTTVSETTDEIINDDDSDIITGTQITAANISSLEDTDAEAVEVFAFDITDAGTTDGVATIVTEIVIEPGTANEALWSSVLAGAQITDGTTVETASSITDNAITFEAVNYTVGDNSTKTFTLSVWLNTSVTDGEALVFEIPATHSVVSDAAGSVIKTTLDAAVTSNTHTIEVSATEFAIDAPAGTKTATDFEVTATAKDENGNTDTAARNVSIDLQSGTGSLTAVGGLATKAMVDGVYTWSDLQYDVEEAITLAVTDGGITTNSVTIDVSNTNVETFENYPETGSAYNDGSFTGIDGSTWTYFQSRGDQTIDGATPMLGKGRTPEAEMTSGTISGGIGTLSFDYSQAFSSNVLLSVYVNGDSITTVTSDTEQGVIKNSGEIIIEVEGDFTLSFKNPTGGQVNIDNVTWTSYVALCSIPTTQATALNATVVDNNTIDLDWTAGDGDATIILARANGAVNADPELLTAYTADAAFASGTEIGTGNYVVYAGADASTQVTALSQGTAYHFAAYTYNTAENCYLLDEPVVANATTTSDNDADSDITTADSPIGITTVSSVANAEADAVNVFNFKIVDAGTADGEPTIVNSVSISAAASNMANWSEVVAGASLSAETFTATNATITENSITFDLTDNLLTVNDGADSTVTLSIWLAESVTDGDTLAFEIPATHNFNASGDGSLFSASVSGASSAKHIIAVEATTLVVSTSSAAIVGNNFDVSVSAEDANGNVDVADRTVTISASGSGTLSGTTELDLTDGTANFTALSYDVVGALTLTATDGTIDGTTDIAISEQPSELVENFDNYDNVGSSYVDGTFLGQDGSTWSYVQARGDVNMDGPSPMLGRNRTPAAEVTSGTISNGIGNLSFDYSQAFSTNVGLEVYVNDNLVATVTSDGETGAVKNSGDIVVEVPGDFVLSFRNPEGAGQVNIDNVTWTTFSATEPTITLDASAFESNFGETAANTTSPSSELLVSGILLEDNITVTAPANFEVSADNTTFSNSVVLTADGQNVDAASVYVRFAPTAIGEVSGDIVASSTNADDKTITVSGMASGENWESGLVQNFTNCDALNTFEAISVTGDQVWACTTTGFDGSAARMSGFESGAQINEDWLVSPVLDGASFTSAYLDFYSYKGFSGEDLELYVSTAYAGEGSIDAADWTLVETAQFAGSSSWTFSGYVDLTAHVGGDFYIAFKYVSDETDAPEWRVDNVRLRGDISTDATFISADDTGFDGNFGKVAINEYSEVRSYAVTAQNLTAELSITPPANFEVSVNADFSGNVGTSGSPLLITGDVDGNITDSTIYVRFQPTEELISYSGDISMTSTDANTVTLEVSGEEGVEGAIILIEDARAMAIESSVQVTGIVIGGPNHSGSNRVIYDGTAGIVVRGLNSGDLVVGDSVVVEGDLDEYNGLLQIAPTTDISIIAQGKALPSPQVVTINEVDETVESELVLVQNVKFVETGVFASGNYNVTNDAGDNVIFRIGSSGHPLVGADIPTEYVNITAIIGQFNEDYQLFSETAEDVEIIINTDPLISVTAPAGGFNFGSVESGVNSDPESFTVSGELLTEDISITVTEGYELSFIESSDYTSALTLEIDEEGNVESSTIYVRFAPRANTGEVVPGSVSITSADLSESVALTGTEIAVVPTITISGADNGFDFGTVATGDFSDSESYTVSGENLEADIVITADANYQVSFSENSAFEQSITLAMDQAGEVPVTTVFVRFAPTAAVGGSLNASVNHTSGSLSEIVNVTGEEELVTANNKALLKDVIVYPNPTKSQLFIELGNNKTYTYKVISLQGSVLKSGKGTGQKTVDVSELSGGVFLLEVSQDDKAYRTRIVKN
ncbi:choice-of-anchor J domain-containing protein [Marivirga sp. S37H4]|uniref:Choice-of-anchor J domain-containing protein n=1 Tax=Marivirga aurantiaca TaxID=2802615 RepID=A0A934WXY5_9BACT|nr:DUF5689 domain-containing protein [Marivirga aurantiaca]MBK6264871.1 choice-of-anchor J domain-containing protein [Marivirga aurantiaca]